MVGYEGLGYFFTTTPLSFSMHMTAIGLALGSVAVSSIIKVTGPKMVMMMPEMGEDAEALEKAKTFSDNAQNAAAIA